MSLMQQGILAAMSDLEAFENDSIRAHFLFPKEFIGFQGHFESNSILPGICKILAVVGMYEKMNQKIFRLIEVAQAKYFLPVTCGQKITIECRAKGEEDGLIVVKASVKREEDKIALLQLTIQAQS